MITFVQINKAYHYAIGEQNKLSIMIFNLFNQEINPPTIKLNSVRAQVEISVSDNFSDEVSCLALYRNTEMSLLTSLGESWPLHLNEKKPTILLALEDRRLYRSVRNALIQNGKRTREQKINRIHEICTILDNKKIIDDNLTDAEELELFDLSIERLITTLSYSMDVKIIDLKKSVNLVVKESFEKVLDQSYKKSGLSTFHQGLKTREEVYREAQKLNGEVEAEKIGESQKVLLQDAYVALLNNLERLSLGDLYQTDNDPVEPCSHSIFTAPNIQ